MKGWEKNYQANCPENRQEWQCLGRTK
jgi:hypothetical protein